MLLAKWIKPVCRYAILAVVALAFSGLGVRGERLPIKNYTTADGLWSSSINYLMKDSHGFIWFCTRDGLSRFDGYRFINYRMGTGSAYPSYMLETRQGVYWIALNGGGLYRYDPRATTARSQPAQADVTSDDGRLTLKAELVSEKNVSMLFEDRRGNLWAGADGLALIEENAGRVSLHQIELHLPGEMKRDIQISAVAEGLDGSLWLGTNHGLLRRLPDARLERLTIQGQGKLDFVVHLLVDREGMVWIGGNGDYFRNPGLYVLKPEPPDVLSAHAVFVSRALKARPATMRDGQLLLPEAVGEVIEFTSVEELNLASQRNPTSTSGPRAIFGIHQASDGRVWVGLRNTLAVFDGRAFHSYSTTQGLVEAGLGPIAEDLDGDLWIGSINGPLRLSARGLKTYDRSDGVVYPEIQSISEDLDGSLCLVSSNGLISRFADGRFRTTVPNIRPGATYAWSSNIAFLDHLGEWWFVTTDGLYRFASSRRIEDLARRRPSAVYTERNGLKTRRTYCMFEDSRGDLWISTRPNDQSLSGLTRWQRSSASFYTFTQADGLPAANSASSFAEDKAGNLWFGFYQGWLARYKAGRFTSFTAQDGLPERFVTGLHVDRQGRLWITSSSGGLNRVDDPTAEHPQFAHYTTREGLASNNARCLTEDLDGRIYIGTVRGVDQLTPETGKFKHYGVADGLAADWVRCAYRDRQGVLWFGTFNGLSRLDPQPERAPVPPSILINGLRVAGVKQALTEFGSSEIAGGELGSTQNNLQIDFSSLSLGHAALLRYQYLLEGADQDWSVPTDQRTVNYANLAPGAYRFLVRAVDPDGVVSLQHASVSFRILAPLWRRWWSLTLAAFVAAATAYALYRYRVARLIELERVRTRIATDLHDDIGSSLSQVSVLSEVVRRRVGVQPDVSEPLSTIAGLSRDLIDSMNDIVWAINPARDQLSDLTQRMRRFAGDVFTARDIQFRFNAPEPRQNTRLGADLRREVFLIFKESINNMLHHAECSEAEIDFVVRAGNLELTLSDNGKGFEPERLSNGNGLANMRRRALKIGGTLDIHSNNGRGTTVKLKARVGRQRWPKT